MWRIPAIRPGGDIAAEPRRAPGTAVAGRTTISQSGAEARIFHDIAVPVRNPGPLALGSSKLALKELASAADGAKGIAPHEKQRRVRGINVAPPSPYLLIIGFINPCIEGVDGLIVVN